MKSKLVCGTTSTEEKNLTFPALYEWNHREGSECIHYIILMYSAKDGVILTIIENTLPQRYPLYIGQHMTNLNLIHNPDKRWTRLENKTITIKFYI